MSVRFYNRNGEVNEVPDRKTGAVRFITIIPDTVCVSIDPKCVHSSLLLLASGSPDQSVLSDAGFVTFDHDAKQIKTTLSSRSLNIGRAGSLERLRTIQLISLVFKDYTVEDRSY